MVTFTPSVWKAEGDKLNTAADEFYRGAHKVIVAERFTPESRSPIEAAMAAGDARCYDHWHHLIANGFEALTDTASRMIGTGSDYKATEADAEAAAKRFW